MGTGQYNVWEARAQDNDLWETWVQDTMTHRNQHDNDLKESLEQGSMRHREQRAEQHTGHKKIRS